MPKATMNTLLTARHNRCSRFCGELGTRTLLGRRTWRESPWFNPYVVANSTPASGCPTITQGGSLLNSPILTVGRPRMINPNNDVDVSKRFRKTEPWRGDFNPRPAEGDRQPTTRLKLQPAKVPSNDESLAEASTAHGKAHSISPSSSGNEHHDDAALGHDGAVEPRASGPPPRLATRLSTPQLQHKRDFSFAPADDQTKCGHQ